MDEMLEAFSEESKSIVVQMVEVLEIVEQDPERHKELAEFARLVDGIMGSAKVIAVDYGPDHLIQKIAAFSELCKFIGQAGAKFAGDVQTTLVITSFLLDATESLKELNDELASGSDIDMSPFLNAAFLKRLKALAEIFDNNRKSSDSVSKDTANSAQADIDAILKQLSS